MFPLASLSSSKDRHLSGLSMHALHAVSFKRNRLMVLKKKNCSSFLFPLKKLLSLRPLGFFVPHWTRMHVNLLGPCFKTGRARAPLDPALKPLLCPAHQKGPNITLSAQRTPITVENKSNHNVIPMNKKRIETTHVSNVVQQKRELLSQFYKPAARFETDQTEIRLSFRKRKASHLQSNGRFIK